MSGAGQAALTEPELDNLIAEFSQAMQATVSGTQAFSLPELLPLVYRELRQVAASLLRQERAGHTLQPTALVHETYLRLLEQRIAQWQNRTHLLAVAARLMRRVLLKHAETRNAVKRNSGLVPTSIDLALDAFDRHQLTAVELDRTLRELEALDARQAEIVELRFFGGLTIEETADVLKVSPATVKREWTTARLWLEREMSAA
jgi:RNA polymerase sigma factor (TIGR02999 family)